MIFFSICLVSNAQIPSPPQVERPQATVSLVAKSFGDSIVLRFAPQSVDAWLAGNQHGYIISRFKVVENNTVLSAPEKQLLTTDPLKPLSLVEIETLYSQDKYAAIVAQAIYGSTFNLNDHGSKTTLINQANELSNRYSFALFSCDVSVNAAKTHGLIYVDRDVQWDEKYVYIIRPNWADTLSVADSAAYFIAVNDTFSVPQPGGIHVNFGDRLAEISWDRKSYAHVFTAYHIERSVAGKENFVRINPQPVINPVNSPDSEVKRMMYIDSLPDNDIAYSYRVRGITPFGETGPPSESVKGKGQNIIVGVNPIMLKSDKFEGGILQLNWEFPGEYESEIEGFVVERGETADGPFTLVSDTLDPGIRSFADNRARNVNYYQVCAVSRSGNLFCTFPSLQQLPDSVPPATPAGLEALIDSSGVVNISWLPNTEHDFMSYKLYRSNHASGDYVQINSQKITDTSFTDTVTLNNLSRSVYYAVSAQDFNYNESERSESTQVIKPDTIAPVAPIIKGFKAADSYIELEWIASSSSDVDKQLLYRSTPDQQQWMLIADFPPGTEAMRYTDSLLTPGTTYGYLFLAVDLAGNESEPRPPVNIKTQLTRGGTSPEIQLVAADDGKSVRILWKARDGQSGMLSIYKCLEGGPYNLLRSLPLDTREFSDTQVKPGQRYGYRVQITDENGVRTVIGAPVYLDL